jgi:hypothetical protein
MQGFSGTIEGINVYDVIQGKVSSSEERDPLAGLEIVSPA